MTLELSGFSRAGGDADDLPLLPPAAAAVWKASWRESLSLLILTALGPVNSSNSACLDAIISAGGDNSLCSSWTGVDVILTVAAALRLPAGGLPSNDASLLLGIEAQAGSVLAKPFSLSPSVGTATVPHASFSPRIAGSPTAATLVLQALVAMIPGDHAVICFPGFSRASPSPAWVIINSAGSDDAGKASWNVSLRTYHSAPTSASQVNATLTLVLGAIDEGSEFSLTIPVLLGLTLPNGGVLGSPTLTVSFTTAGGAGMVESEGFREV